MQRVSELSRGRFKPSSIGGWERGEREISLQRFCELAEIYAVPPDRLLDEALDAMSPQNREEVVIDLTRLPLLEGEEPELLRVAEFVHGVRARRGDYLGEILTLRSGDLDEIALGTSMKPGTLRSLLEPAIRPAARH
jgi:transcriptional regulator with XRE-family HTH domain